MAALHRAKAQNILDATLGVAAFVATTTPVKARLYTVVGTDSAAGTECTGGSYAGQTITFAAATNASPPVSVSNAVVSYAGMPACTVAAAELWDSSATPARLAFGPLGASKAVNAGDTFQFASGAVTLSDQ